MRKSNILIIAIAVVASVFFLWLWYYLQFNLVDNPLDLVLTIVWWAIVIIVCVVIHKVEQKRCIRLRTCFVAPGLVYNPAAGSVSIQSSSIDTIQGILENLDYDFDIADQPDAAESRPASFYQLIVRSQEFQVDSDSEAQANGLHAVKEWQGEVAVAGNPNAAAKKFSNREELAALLA